jgi:uncharacterized membrane protein YfhO
MKAKILASFLIYGLIVGFLSAWWWGFSDAIFFFNIPGVVLGDEVYSLAIYYLGDPSSPYAHFTIPWILRIPQVYVPVSITFWGLAGLLLQLSYNRLIKKQHTFVRTTV